ncbi:MAG: hypothetical protein F6K21_18840 [Symploca sp. SIO2D2]|nr:hypothetical protein [Symploca sp. SIO2D2]
MKIDPLIAEWTRSPLSRKTAYVVGSFIVLTGIVHLIAFPFIQDAVWSGPAGFRKPIVFGISAGLTVITMAWLLRYFHPQPRLHALMMYSMSVTLIIEIVIIDLQRFRGVPSHFNTATPFDSVLWALMAQSILVFAIVSMTQGILSFRKLTAPPALSAAIRGSMILFFLSQVSGQLIVQNGLDIVTKDGVFIMENVARSTVYGEAGNLKLPHAITLHSIQALPLLGLLFAALPQSASKSGAWVWISAAGFFGLAATAQSQAYLGKSIQDLDPLSAAILSLSIATFTVPFAYVLSLHLKCCIVKNRKSELRKFSQA